MASKDLRQIGAALSKFWAGGDGPTDANIRTAITVAGAEASLNGSNKQKLVLETVSESDDSVARDLIEELLTLLREPGWFDDVDNADKVKSLEQTVAATTYSLTPDFHINWQKPSPAPLTVVGTAPATPVLPVTPSFSSATAPVISGTQPAVLFESSPDIDLLCWSLYRLGIGAATKALTIRRFSRPGIDVDDEHDVQDLVELTLRVLFLDVRPEEPTASSAGSSSKMDFFLPKLETAVEVKVAKKSGDAKKVKHELLVDFNDYATHRAAKHVIGVVYDFNTIINNPTGFETGLTKDYNGIDGRVLVSPWIAPRHAPAVP